MQYLLLLYASYESDDLVTVRTASLPLILGTTNADPRIVARGRSRSGPFKWHWSIVTVESLSLDATTSKRLKVFPFLQSNATNTAPPVVMPWRLLATPPPWIKYFSLGAYHNATGYGPVEILSSPEANSLAGYADPMAASGIEYSQCLSFYNDDQHPGWYPDVKLGDMPEYLVADNFDVTPQNFLIYTGKTSGDLFEYDTSSWPQTMSSIMEVKQMPWLTIILTLLSFFASKKSGASNTKAAITAGLVGAGSYYVTHETDWGKVNLGALDGVTVDGDGKVADAGGNPVTGSDGKPITTGGNSGGTSFADVIRGWGATGTAAVIGAGAAATGSGIFSSKNLPWLIGGGVVLFLLLSDD